MPGNGQRATVCNEYACIGLASCYAFSSTVCFFCVVQISNDWQSVYAMQICESNHLNIQFIFRLAACSTMTFIYIFSLILFYFIYFSVFCTRCILRVLFTAQKQNQCEWQSLWTLLWKSMNMTMQFGSGMNGNFMLQYYSMTVFDAH